MGNSKIRNNAMENMHYGNVDFYYEFIYDKLDTGRDSLISRWLIHRQVETIEEKTEDKIRLELGGGGGQHLKYLYKRNDKKYKSYIASDINFNSLKKYEINYGSNLSLMQIDAEELPFKDKSIDEIIGTCFIAHLKDPEKALIEMARVLKNGGKCNFIIPIEPSFLMNTVRKIYQAPQARKFDFEGYELMIAREHRYNWQYLVRITRHTFRHYKVKVKFVPFLIHLGNFNLSIVIKVFK